MFRLLPLCPYVLPGNLLPKTSQNVFFFFSGFLGLGVDGNKQVGTRSWPSRWCQPGDILYGGWG